MRTDAGEDAIDQTHDRLLGGYEASALRQQHDDRGLAQERRLAGHVRASENDDLLARRVELEVVGDECAIGEMALHQRMPAALDGESQASVDVWTPPPLANGCDRQASECVEAPDRLSGGAKGRRR